MPDGNGAVEVSAGDRHSEAGKNPVKHGGGEFSAVPKPGGTRFCVINERGHSDQDRAEREVQQALAGIDRRCGLRDRRALRQDHQCLLDARVVALEHVDDDLEVGQRLRQRLLHIRRTPR